MRAFIAIVLREIDERKALLAAAAVASVLPLLAPFLPATGSNPASDIREAVTWVMVGSLVPVFALLLGVSFIGRDLAEGRMGFYYAQPLSGSTIWLGKLAAVIVLVLGAEILIMFPTALLSPDFFHFLAPRDVLGPFEPRWSAALVLWLAPLLIILLSHALGLIWRGRSAWLLVDFGGLILVIAGTWLAIRPFLPITAPGAALAAASWMVAWMLVGLIVSGAVQVTSGRVDLGRGHRVLSATLWSVLVAAAATVLAWSLWIRAAAPNDLTRVASVTAGSGDWIAVSGTSPGRLDYHPRFLFNVSDGRWVAIDPAIRWWGPDLVFSADGSTAVWPATESAGEWTVNVARLDVSQPQPRKLGVVAVGRRWDDLSVSPDGSRIAVVDGRSVAAYESGAGDQITAAVIEGEFHPIYASFWSEDRILILASTSSRSDTSQRWRRYLLDLESKTLSEDAELPHPWRWKDRGRVSQSGRYLDRIDVEGDDRLVVVDASTRDVATDLGPMPYWSRISETEGGLIAIARDREGDHHIDVFTSGGELLRQIGLDKAQQILFGGELKPGQLVVGLWTWNDEERTNFEKLRTSVVDLNSGKVGPTLEGVAPVLGPWMHGSSAGAWKAGATAGRLLLGEDGSLGLLAPDSSRVEQLIPSTD